MQVFGLAAAKTGWSEKQLRAAGRDFYAVHVHPASHAGYYPGAETLSMKLLADPATDRILGAQIVGRDGVDKRIDVIATALQAGVTAAGLAHLELAYAPQFGSAKDAVNILGYVAENTRSGTTPTLQWHELDDALQAGAALIDVRSAGEYANGAIPGARNIPLDELRDRLDELPDGPLVVHCQVGLRRGTSPPGYCGTTGARCAISTAATAPGGTRPQAPELDAFTTQENRRTCARQGRNRGLRAPYS